MFGVQVLSWLVLLVCIGVGFVVGTRAGSRRFRIATISIGAMAVGLAIAIHLGVDDGQPFVVQSGRFADNDEVTSAPRGWLYVRTLLFDVGLGLLFGAAVMRLAARREERRH